MNQLRTGLSPDSPSQIFDLSTLTHQPVICAEMESCTSNSSDNNNHWRAEEAIGGNTEALQALRELIIFPLQFSQEAQKLGLKVQIFPLFIMFFLLLISGSCSL